MQSRDVSKQRGLAGIGRGLDDGDIAFADVKT
jgi:hypothetical protein